MRKQAKLQGDILTVRKILDKEALKDLADKIVSEDIDDIILLYRDVKTGNKMQWATTIKGWATVFGEMEMLHRIILDDWEIQSIEDEQNEE